MRNIFYSFQFKNDVMRVQQIRNIGTIVDNKPVSLSKWEELQAGGDSAIRRWIDSSIARASCVVVLIGSETHNSKWVRYEIEKAWNEGKGLVGVRIHNLSCPRTGKSAKGQNPFSKVTLKDGTNLSSKIEIYDPKNDTYNWIANNIETVVEKGISCRRKL